MINTLEAVWRSIRRTLSRSEWTIRLLRLSKLKKRTSEPGLVMIQIDGLSLTQFNRAVLKGQVPFMAHLLKDEHYAVHAFYSGIPSNTPAVQGELFYGVKGCVPGFSFVDKPTGQAIKMFDAAYVEKFDKKLRTENEGLLKGGSSYCNIYTGGAEEGHFCWAQLGWGGVKHAANPVVFPFLFILYLDIFVRTIILLIIELFLSIVECIRGTVKGRFFPKEVEMVWLRVLVCIVLREFMVAGACMDIMRGRKIIHLNFLGYDEQAHCRGPSSALAHWALHGIDDAIKRIYHVMGQSPHRHYDLWVYGDHGQEKTTPYLIKYGRTVEAAIEELFNQDVKSILPSATRLSRAHLLKPEKATDRTQQGLDASTDQTVVTAMGPLGHVYCRRTLSDAERDDYARKLVADVKIPLVMARGANNKLLAYTPSGVYDYPAQAAEVFGSTHPFIEELKEDVTRMCDHPYTGDFVIAGWSHGQDAISFPVEYGAHASMGSEETKAFALLPADVPLVAGKAYIRPLDLREAARAYLSQNDIPAKPKSESTASHTLRIMSYNVHGCQGMDGHISPDRIARVIARQNPDVVALQELDWERQRSGGLQQAERIARKLEMQYHFHSVFRWEDGQYGNAIFSKYPISLVKMEALPHVSKNDQIEQRGAMWVTLDVGGTKVNILNTHLSVWPQERVKQIGTLIGEDWLGHPQCTGPVVLCGDFNAIPSSTTYKLISTMMIDTQSALEDHRPRRTLYGRYPLGQIDYIFVTPHFKVRAINVPRSSLEKLSSDHLPLVVTLADEI